MTARQESRGCVAEETINEPQYSRPRRREEAIRGTRPGLDHRARSARTRDGGGAGTARSTRTTPPSRSSQIRSSAKRIVNVWTDRQRRRSARSAGRASSPPRPRPRARSPRASWTHRPAAEPLGRQPRRGAAPRPAGPRTVAASGAEPHRRSSLCARRRSANSATGTLPSSPSPWRRTATVALLRLAVADDEHVGDLAQLGLADLAPDRLGAVVELGAQAGRAQRVATTSRAAVVVAVGDRQHDRLDRREPERELARVVLDAGCR